MRRTIKNKKKGVFETVRQILHFTTSAYYIQHQTVDIPARFPNYLVHVEPTPPLTPCRPGLDRPQAVICLLAASSHPA